MFLISFYSFAIIYLYVLIWFWRSARLAPPDDMFDSRIMDDAFDSRCMPDVTFAAIVSDLSNVSWGSDDLPN